MTRRPHECQARQYGDQIICAACGLNWDMNDPDPPQCRPVDKRTKRAKAVAKFEADLKPKTSRKFPLELPADVAAEMVTAYQARGGSLAGMRAAYRLLLDRIEP